MSSEVRYVALRAFQASHNGQTWDVRAGDELPNAGEWRALNRMLTHGYVAMVPLDGSIESYSDAALIAECERRGIQAEAPAPEPEPETETETEPETEPDEPELDDREPEEGSDAKDDADDDDLADGEAEPEPDESGAELEPA